MKRALQGTTLLLMLWLPFCAQAQLTLSCSVVTLPVVFGQIDPAGPGAIPTTGTITVSCLGINLLGVTYDIALSAGAGSYAQRKMLSGSHELLYNIYTASNYQTVWGDGNGGTSKVSGGLTVLVSAQPHTVYARIPGSQNVPAGTFSDALTVTVSY